MAILYEVLGVVETANLDEIKNAYRRQAMRWHPDRNPENRKEAEERFKEIGYAYKVLTDPGQRRDYNSWLAAQRSANTGATGGSAYDDGQAENMSSGDADRIFYEQMLDLATELVMRGYTESTIIKTLIGLDCPEAIAKAVTRRGNQRAAARDAYQEKASADKQTIEALESASWEAAEPYYVAVVGGKHAKIRLEEAAYQKQVAAHKKSLRAYFLCVPFIFLGLIIGNKSGAWLLVIADFWLLIVAIWRIAIDNAEFRRERVLRHYLAAFESYHNVAPLPRRFADFNIGAFFISYCWFAYRRMPGYALLATAAIVIFGATQIYVVALYPQLLYVTIAVWLSVQLTLAVMANRIYFKNAQAKIRKWVAHPRDEALRRLREDGGTNNWSWLVFAFLFNLLSIPLFLYLNETEEQQAATTAQVANGQQAPAEGQVEEQRQFDAVVAEMVARHPELNAKHPQFNQALVDDAIARINRYIEQGNTRSNAVRLAIFDMENEASAAPSVRR